MLYDELSDKEKKYISNDFLVVKKIQEMTFVKEMVKQQMLSSLKAQVSVDIIGDTLVVSTTAIQDIVYTYSFHFDAFVLELPPETLSAFIVKKALKRYKRYIKNLFFKNEKKLDYLDTTLYNR